MSVELPQDADDRALLAAIADKDQQAFQHFYRRYSAVVYAISRRITGQDQDAEDVVSDVFWELWEKSSRYCASKSSPYSYLVMLTRCRALDRKRGLSARRVHAILEWATDDTALQAFQTSTSDDPCVSAESRRVVQQAIQNLDPNQQQAVEMIFFDGLTHQATAKKLGVPLGTVKGRVRSALTRLRGTLQSYLR